MNHTCADCDHSWKDELFVCPLCGSFNIIGVVQKKTPTVYVAELADYVKKVKRWIPKDA